MRILLDECVDESLHHEFAGHYCETCRYAGFKGLANGELMPVRKWRASKY